MATVFLRRRFCDQFKKKKKDYTLTSKNKTTHAPLKDWPRVMICSPRNPCTAVNVAASCEMVKAEILLIGSSIIKKRRCRDAVNKEV